MRRADVGPAFEEGGRRRPRNAVVRPLPERVDVRKASGSKRLAVACIVIVAGLAAASLPATAQSEEQRFWPMGGVVEVRGFGGALVPLGAQKQVFDRAVLTGFQWSWHFSRPVAVTGTVAWSPNHARQTSGDPAIDIFQFDLGVEARGGAWLSGEEWDVRPFLGVGAGGRTYVFRHLNSPARMYRAGYGAGGADFGFGPVGLRLEVRDYVTRFRQFFGPGVNTWRNELALSAGFRLRL
jgi:hypothetical protein